MSPIHGRNNVTVTSLGSPLQSATKQPAAGKGVHRNKPRGVSASAGFLAFYRGHDKEEEDLPPHGPSARVARQDTRSPHLLLTDRWDNGVSSQSPSSIRGLKMPVIEGEALLTVRPSVCPACLCQLGSTTILGDSQKLSLSPSAPSKGGAALAPGRTDGLRVLYADYHHAICAYGPDPRDLKIARVVYLNAYLGTGSINLVSTQTRLGRASRDPQNRAPSNTGLD